MANQLDEITGPVNNAGQDVHVINRQLPVKVGIGSTLFQIALWVVGPAIVLLYMLLGGGKQSANPVPVTIIGCLVGMLPGLIFLFMKVSARNYFQQLEQRI